MDVFKTLKLWRGIGRVLNTRIGSSISHAIGQPNNRLGQMTILRGLLLLLQTAEEPGILTDLPDKWKRSVNEEISWDSFTASGV